jgi:uncharacterized membrane protein YqjE
MVQTRAEAAGLVVQLQRTAVAQGLLFAGIAAVTALSFMTAVIVWIAVAAPEAWRAWALGFVALALLAGATFAGITAVRRLQRDASLIADFSRGLKLDLAMVSLALKDAQPEDEEKAAERERAKTAVREAAAAKAAAPSTAEGGGMPAPEGPAMNSASAAMRAATPGPTVAAPGTEASDRPSGGRSAAPTGAPPTATPASAVTGQHHEPAAWGVGISPSASPTAMPASTPSASGQATTDSSAPPLETQGRRATSGYAMTGGGTYASTSAADMLAAGESERELPDPLSNPADSDLTHLDTTERKDGHGSA